MSNYNIGIGHHKRKKLSRKEAIEMREPVYLGPKCPRGHDGFRYTVNASCVECLREAGAKKRYGAVGKSAISKIEALREKRELERLQSGDSVFDY